MRVAIYMAILMVLVMFSAPKAYPNDGNMLYDSMKSPDKMHNIAAEGYITGVYELMIEQGSFCPEGLVHDQIIEGVGYFLQESPNARNEPASLIIFAILNTMKPCEEVGEVVEEDRKFNISLEERKT